MKLDSHISHYFERDYGPFRSICNLSREKRKEIIEREAAAATGYNRSDFGQEFFDFRLLADDLTIRCYKEKFGFTPECRPIFGVLGDADVIGGLYRNPSKIHIDVSLFEESELTFMFPDHFHLVSYYGVEVPRYFGIQTDAFPVPERSRFLGQMFTYAELQKQIDTLLISEHLKRFQDRDFWYRYLEVQIWTEKLNELFKQDSWISVKPESFSNYLGMKCLVDYDAL